MNPPGFLKNHKKMSNFLLAIRFLTSVPLKTEETIDEERLSGAVIYFPLVGLLLGLILAGLNLMFTFFAFNPLLINAIVVITLISLTGALHLDGLADTFDSLCSGKDKETMLKIMRDPHIGAMGVLSLISVILLKITILSSLDLNAKNIALIFMCVLSRWSLILPVYLFSYARKEGKAKGFFGNLSFGELLFSTLAALLFACLIWNWKGLLVFTLVFVFTYFFNRYVNKRIGGATGDTLGASLELNEVLILFACLLVCKI